MDAAALGIVGLAAALAGAVNSVAGGGSLISFPTALAVGLPPVIANATNTVALTPGGVAAAYAYRRELGHRWRLALLLALPAALGGLGGAFALLAAPERVFQLVVPWLVALATLLLVLQERLQRRALERGVARQSAVSPVSPTRKWLVAAGLAVVAVYGGYFGAGIGIVTLALLGALGEATIHELNAMKTVVVAAINGTAAVYFLASGRVSYPAAAAMAAGAILGGWAGASLARKAKPALVRWVVVAIGVGLSVALALRFWA